LATSITVQGQAGASTITTQGGTLQMVATVLPTNVDNGTYAWSVVSGTGSASIDQSGLLTAATNGDVTVSATANDGSGTTGIAVITISNQTVGINEAVLNSKFSIYPNPVNSQINIDSVEKIETIEIIDLMGKTLEIIITPNNTIDVSYLTKGVYFLQIQSDKGLVSKKFIKE
jgi:hypothetical protein